MRLRRLLPFFVTLGVVPFLPIYPRCEMARSQVVGHPGDVVFYHWHVGALVSFLTDFGDMAPEEHGGVLLVANLLLGATLSAVLGFAMAKIWHSFGRWPRW